MGRFILSANPNNFQFYAPFYLQEEIERHLSKIMKISGLSEIQIRRILLLLYSQINFIACSQVPFEIHLKAYGYVHDIDLDDIPFVALTEYLEEVLWTGDEELYKGLVNKGYERVIQFETMRKIHHLDV